MKKNIIRYLIIFFVVSIITFIATVLFVNINNYKLNSQQLAFVDLESGEVISFPEFEYKEAGMTEQVCLRNSNGQIVFWGELDYNSGIISGDILSTPSMIQIGNYCIMYNSTTVQAEKDEENRHYLTIHYCGIN